jgi:hypothetical protein
VRRVPVQVGTTRSRSLTTGTDPQQLPGIALARRSARRWDIELAVTTVTREVGLPQGWAVLLIAQIVPALRLEVAGRAGVDPFAVSLPLLGQDLPRLAATGHAPLPVVVEQGRQLACLRPSRRPRIAGPASDPADLTLPPPGLVVEREPRDARRTGGPRHDRDTPRTKELEQMVSYRPVREGLVPSRSSTIPTILQAAVATETGGRSAPCGRPSRGERPAAGNTDTLTETASLTTGSHHARR